MYWTDSEMDCIEVSRLNGTSRKRLFEKGLVNPRAIVVNPQRGYVPLLVSPQFSIIKSMLAE